MTIERTRQTIQQPNSQHGLLRQMISVLSARIDLARQVRRERHALRQLTDNLLADIGRSRQEVDTEVRRAPWDLPQRRLPAPIERPTYAPVSPIGFMRPMS